MNDEWREQNALAIGLGEQFRDEGFQLYAVGGMVRDALLGREHTDIDLATDATPDEVHRLLRHADHLFDQGAEFGTVGAIIGDTKIEVTTFRKEVYRPDDRHPEVTYTGNVFEDLARRDFTINTMAISLPEGELMDPHHGIKDLVARLLDTPTDPQVTFEEDPLRMLRAARFISAFELVPSERVLAAVRSMGERLRIISPERTRDELDKLLVSEHPSLGLMFLVETGLGQHFLPELNALHMPNYRNRHKDVLKHTLTVVEQCPPDPILRLAALMHDVGKPATRNFVEGGVQFYGHEVVGAEMARRRLKALRYPNSTVDAVTTLVELHLTAHGSWEWNDSAVRRYVRRAGDQLDRLNLLSRADVTTQKINRRARLAAYHDLLEQRIAKLREQEELDSMRPDLDGQEVMAILGVEPGPVVGKALAHLFELRIERGPLGKEEATKELLAWAQDELEAEAFDAVRGRGSE